VPSHQGGGLDEEQGLLPPLREAGGDDHPPPVGGRELWSADLAAQNEELLAKEGVRRHQLGSRPDTVAHHAVDLEDAVTADESAEDGEDRRQGGSEAGARGLGHPWVVSPATAVVNAPRRLRGAGRPLLAGDPLAEDLPPPLETPSSGGG